jgi:hypothetical protein
MSNEGSTTVNQTGAKSFAAALWNPRAYEIYIDHRKVGLLNGYQNQKTLPQSPLIGNFDPVVSENAGGQYREGDL